MKKGDRLSQRSAAIGHRCIPITLCAIVAVAILSCVDILSTRAYFQGWGRLPSRNTWVVEGISGSNADGTLSQHAMGDDSWVQWTMVARPESSNSIGARQISATERTCGWNAPNGNQVKLAGIKEVASHLMSGSAYSISDSESYTMYLPLVQNKYTHPLLNGDFEIMDRDFAEYWDWEGDLSTSITNTLSNGGPCYSGTGTHCALLGSPTYLCEGGIPIGYGRICQTFGVPSTGMPTLLFHYRIFSYDECGHGRFDSIDVEIDDVFDEASPILLLRDGSMDGEYGCGEDKLDITDWKESPELDLSVIPDTSGGTVDFRGKTVRLCFYNQSRELSGYTVAWYNTWVYVDAVQVRQD